MRFQSFASGSSGNCIYVGSETTHLLVDVGISRKRTVESLNQIGIDINEVNGILITHEHSDHIGGLPMIAKKSDMPIYATAGTIQALQNNPKTAAIDHDRYIEVKADTDVTVGDITVNPIAISHDAADPCGYRLFYDGKKVCICTDLGCYTDYTVEALKDSDMLLLEANHDVNMLQVGPYPYHLKQRILGDHGHLSNLSSGELLSRVLNDHMKGILLGHLSQENNMPELAFQTVRVELASKEEKTGFRADELPLGVARRRDVSPMVEF